MFKENGSMSGMWPASTII